MAAEFRCGEEIGEGFRLWWQKWAFVSIYLRSIDCRVKESRVKQNFTTVKAEHSLESLSGLQKQRAVKGSDCYQELEVRLTIVHSHQQ